jgi:hypothetical protein
VATNNTNFGLVRMKIEQCLKEGHKPYLLLKHLLPPGIDKEIVNATQDQYESLK